MPETPKKPTKPRPPGSQVSPNPMHKARGGMSHADATAGRKYRVRDKANEDGEFTLWGEDLSHADAVKLKETVVGQRKSKTARVEEMPEPEPGFDAATEIGGGAASVVSNSGLSGLRPEDLGWMPVVVNPDAIGDPNQTPVVQLPQGLINMMVASGQVTVVATDGDGTPDAVLDTLIREDKFNAPSADPELEKIRLKAVAAAAPAARAAQAKHDHKKIMMKDPPKPPPSPLSDELLDIPDGPAELPDEVLESGDVQTIMSEVGGGPGDDDKDRAKKQAAQDYTDSVNAALVAYGSAVASDKHPDTWPPWEELGPFEQAAWRFYAAQGGQQPSLTRTMRKVKESMLTPDPEPSEAQS